MQQWQGRGVVIIVLLKGKNSIVYFTTNLTTLGMTHMVKIRILVFAGVISCGAHTQELTRRLGSIQKLHPPTFITIVQKSCEFTS